MPYLSHASCASATVRDERRLQKPVEAGLAADKLRLLCGMKAFQSYSEPRTLPRGTAVVYAVVRPSSLSLGLRKRAVTPQQIPRTVFLRLR